MFLSGKMARKQYTLQMLNIIWFQKALLDSEIAEIHLWYTREPILIMSINSVIFLIIQIVGCMMSSPHQFPFVLNANVVMSYLSRSKLTLCHVKVCREINLAPEAPHLQSLSLGDLLLLKNMGQYSFNAESSQQFKLQKSFCMNFKKGRVSAWIERCSNILTFKQEINSIPPPLPL